MATGMWISYGLLVTGTV